MKAKEPEAPKQYRQQGQTDREEDLVRWHAWHFKFPALPGSVFNPSGLVPYPCEHGIPVKPKRFPVTKGGTAWYDDAGNERPPYGARSWGRAKYLVITSFGGRDGIPYAESKCFVCLGRAVGDDFYYAADGSSLL